MWWLTRKLYLKIVYIKSKTSFLICKNNNIFLFVFLNERHDFALHRSSMTCIKNNTNNKLSLENWRVHFGIDLDVEFSLIRRMPEKRLFIWLQFLTVVACMQRTFLNVVTTYTYKSTCKDVCDILNNFLVAYARTIVHIYTHRISTYSHTLRPVV